MSLIYSPGPAAYTLPSTRPTKPAVSIKGRYSTSHTSNTPSPHSYTIDIQSLYKGPSYTIRPKTKIIQPTESVPGYDTPLIYNIHQYTYTC